jgi:hypothetical protein
MVTYFVKGLSSKLENKRAANVPPQNLPIVEDEI